MFVDLGASPLSNSYLKPDQLDEMEPYYPLTVRVCTSCWLAQLPEIVRPAHIFEDYAYFSSYSDSWLKHSLAYAETMTQTLGLGRDHRVIELASNDGYLLQYFIQKGIPVLGVEPAANVAQVALAKGIPTLVKFFGVETARSMIGSGLRADLLIGNNVFGHVPDLNDFIAGMKLLLNPKGVITLEFPHLQRLMQENQFDTMYHEHFSYYSLIAAEQALARHGLRVFDVEELTTHGGSLRLFAGHVENAAQALSPRVVALREQEIASGLQRVDTYLAFAQRVVDTKFRLLEFLIQAKKEGKRIVGYGAPAKGNTILNYCGIRTDFIDYTVDRSPHKQGRFLPGSRIPIYAPDRIRADKPDYVFILPWNLRTEIVEQMSYIREWGGRFMVAIPSVEILP